MCLSSDLVSPLAHAPRTVRSRSRGPRSPPPRPPLDKSRGFPQPGATNPRARARGTTSVGTHRARAESPEATLCEHALLCVGRRTASRLLSRALSLHSWCFRSEAGLYVPLSVYCLSLYTVVLLYGAALYFWVLCAHHTRHGTHKNSDDTHTRADLQTETPGLPPRRCQIKDNHRLRGRSSSGQRGGSRERLRQ